jgi:1,4-alpha-glucan branching enzyme
MPVDHGGLGFTFKWNMGWMHDTLDYFSTDPLFRAGRHNLLTFGMMYEYSEHFLMPLSHDEVVHGKGTLLSRMPGDEWQQFANLRALLAYQYARPGKSMLFMGSELGSTREWNHDTSLDWHLVNRPFNAGLLRFLADLSETYRSRPELWRGDSVPESFAWLDPDDRQHSTYSFLRRDGNGIVIALFNLTPVPRHDYRVGVPRAGSYRMLLSSDADTYCGSSFGLVERVETEDVQWNYQPVSFRIGLPPLGAVLLAWEPDGS